MDFDPNEDQLAILEAVDALLAQRAGPARAIELQPKADYDAILDAALAESGFSDIGRDEAMGLLEAELLVERVARAGGVVAIGAEAVVAPALRIEPFETPIALVDAGRAGLVRYAAHARTLLVLAADEARAVAVAPGECAAVRSNFGYPLGRVTKEILARGDGLGAGSADRLRRHWLLAVAAEAVGTMDGALSQTVRYLKQRKQFGRTIGSFQAVQHRLAECAIHVEGSRWLVREAAHHGAPAEGVAAAAAFTLAAAERIFSETHQLSGAIGFTREHDLHVYSMRLQALRLELGGVRAHRQALVDARFRGTAS